MACAFRFPSNEYCPIARKTRTLRSQTACAECLTQPITCIQSKQILSPRNTSILAPQRPQRFSDPDFESASPRLRKGPGRPRSLPAWRQQKVAGNCQVLIADHLSVEESKQHRHAMQIDLKTGIGRLNFLKQCPE